MANRTRAQLSTDSLGFFPNNNSQLISPQDLRDWITNGIESFVTQKDTSEFQNAFYECRGSAITATSGTTNLALAGGNFVHITGTVPPAISINSFGTLPPGSRFVLCFDIPVTIVYNATTLIIPGAANIVTAAGDCIMLISEGSGAWRLIGYFPGTGLPVGTVTAVTASAPLSATSGNAPNLSIPQANGSTDGFLDSADWTTFNNKGNGTVTSITAGTGLNGGTITNSGTIDLANTAVTAGAYTNTNITVDAQGRITAASNGSGGGGGSPGGANGDYQYKNGGSFDGSNLLRFVSGFVVAHTPKIGDSNSTGHFHMHSANSAPSGIADFLTMFWQKASRSIGFRSETDTNETYIQLTAPTADRTLTLPDASGNVVIDTTVPSFSNGASEGEVRFKEAGGSDYIGLKAPSSVATPITFTLPNSDGTPGTVIQTNGSGVLSWVNNGGAQALQYLKNTTHTNVVTNPTTTTILESLIIPAGTFTSNNAFMLVYRIICPIGVTNGSYSMWINTSNSIGAGAIQLAGPSVLGSNASNTANLAFQLFGGLTGNFTRYMSGLYTNSTNIGNLVNTIDWTQTQYFILTCGASTNRSYRNDVIAVNPI